jgi:hypothetical protein
MYVVNVDGIRLSLNCGHQQAYFSSSRTCMSVESYDGIIDMTGGN